MTRPASMLGRTAARAGLLFAAWVVLSGKIDALHLGSGAAAALVIGYAGARRARGAAFPALRFLGYVPWLLGQVLRSNLHVARLALLPGARIRPALVERDPGTSDERALALIACSITLTPGTLAVEAAPGRVLVHALDEESARDFEDAAIARRVGALFDGGRP